MPRLSAKLPDRTAPQAGTVPPEAVRSARVLSLLLVLEALRLAPVELVRQKV
jgi:hypothetical protein